MLLKWAIVLLAKTSHAVCSETSCVFFLPSISCVLCKTKDLNGKKESTIGGMKISTIQSMHRELIKNEKIIIRGCLVFDTMQLQDGIDWDINQNKITSIDPMLSFDIVNAIFKKVANENQCHNYSHLLILSLCFLFQTTN